MIKNIKKTKIIATLGPASIAQPVVKKLLHNGANVFRVNFSHGSVSQHAATIRTVRETARAEAVPCALLADLQGPKIRTGKTLNDRPVILTEGRNVYLTASDVMCTDRFISVGYPKLAEEIKEGQHVLLNDGAVRLQVLSVEKSKKRVLCRVKNTGAFSSHKGVNFPGVSLSVPSFTVKDRGDCAFALKQGVEYLALSFVRRAADLDPLIRMARRLKSSVKIIAKIEKPEACRNIGEILQACDGIMVARGDLGVEMAPESVPLLQKELIERANNQGKLVIVATQMLESMIAHPLPTRAEASDVANAILDGADAVMLSGETAVGMYPVEAVRMMRRIAVETESSRYYPDGYVDLSLRDRYPPHAICEAAATASRDLGNVPAVVFTLSGDTALYLSKIRFQAPIYAFCPNPHVVSMLSAAWNVTPFLLPLADDVTSLQKAAEYMLIERRFIKRNELVVVVSGTTTVRGATSFMRVRKTGER